MAALVAVGLDGREIPPEEIEPETTDSGPRDGMRYDIEIFDHLPRWARAALRDVPKFDVHAHDIAPHIEAGTVNQFNITGLLLQNDAIHREHFREKDRADGIA